MLTNTIGFLASCIAFIMFIPSAVTIYKNRHDAHALRGSSIGMNLLLVTNALLWGVYGFLSSAFLGSGTRFSQSTPSSFQYLRHRALAPARECQRAAVGR